MPLIMILPGRSDDKMFENEAFLPPQVMALRSSSFMSDKGFNGLLNSKACAGPLNLVSQATFAMQSNLIFTTIHIRSDRPAARSGGHLQQQHALAAVLQRIAAKVESSEASMLPQLLEWDHQHHKNDATQLLH
jgi:hypothetical protein